MEAPEPQEREELVDPALIDPERVEIEDFGVEDDAEAWRE